MNLEIQKILHKIEEICRNNNISHLYLFGSYAKGTEQLGSDIDVVVKGVDDYKKLIHNLDNIRTLKTINVFNYDTITNKFLIEDIDQYAKIIY